MKRNDHVKINDLNEGDVFHLPTNKVPCLLVRKEFNKITYYKNHSRFQEAVTKNLLQEVVYLRTV